MLKFSGLTTAILMGTTLIAQQPGFASPVPGEIAGAFTIQSCSVGGGTLVISLNGGSSNINITDQTQIAVVGPACGKSDSVLFIGGNPGAYSITVVPSASVITGDDSGSINTPAGQWQITGGQAYLNNAPAGFTAGVIRLAVVAQQAYQENIFGKWWIWDATDGYWIPSGDPR